MLLHVQHAVRMASLTLFVESSARAQKFQVAAKYAFAGSAAHLEVKVVDDKSAAAKDATASTPFGILPVLRTPQGSVARSSAILRYIAGLREDAALYGSTLDQEAMVDTWFDWSFANLEPLFAVLDSPKLDGYTAEQLSKASAAAKSKLPALLQYLESYLSTRTFLAAERVTLADIAIVSAMSSVWAALKVLPGFDKLVNIQRWYQTCRHQPEFVAVLGSPDGAPAGSIATSSAAAEPSSWSAPAGSSSAGWSSVVGTGINTQIDGKFRRHRQRISDVLKAGESLIGTEVTVCGWAKTIREGGAGSLQFIALNDGSCFDNIQAVAEKGKTEGFDSVGKSGGTGSSIKVVGQVVKSPAKGQAIEILATSVSVLGSVADPATYPLAKKKHGLETLREIQHLRPRTNTIGAVTRVRNACAYATHKFFQERGFLYIHTPIITCA